MLTKYLFIWIYFSIGVLCQVQQPSMFAFDPNTQTPASNSIAASTLSNGCLDCTAEMCGLQCPNGYVCGFVGHSCTQCGTPQCVLDPNGPFGSSSSNPSTDTSANTQPPFNPIGSSSMGGTAETSNNPRGNDLSSGSSNFPSEASNDPNNTQFTTPEESGSRTSSSADLPVRATSKPTRGGDDASEGIEQDSSTVDSQKVSSPEPTSSGGLSGNVKQILIFAGAGAGVLLLVVAAVVIVKKKRKSKNPFKANKTVLPTRQPKPPNHHILTRDSTYTDYQDNPYRESYYDQYDYDYADQYRESYRPSQPAQQAQGDNFFDYLKVKVWGK